MIRLFALYLLYLFQKIRYLGRVNLVGFSIILAFRNSSISIGKGSGLCSTPVYNLLGMYQRTILVARHGGTIHIGGKCRYIRLHDLRYERDTDRK